jgi:hypothetical protein
MNEIDMAEAQAKAAMLVRKAWEKFMESFSQNGGVQPPQGGINAS